MNTTAAARLHIVIPPLYDAPVLQPGSATSASLARFVAAHRRRSDGISRRFDAHLASVREWIAKVDALDRAVAGKLARDGGENLPARASTRAVDAPSAEKTPREGHS